MIKPEERTEDLARQLAIEAAIDAVKRYGKGIDASSRLNMGDCAA